jgi:hypothetical protein
VSVTGTGQDDVSLGGRPPFAFRVEVPDDWTVFDTAPESWRRSAQALIGAKRGSERLSPAQRRGALEILADVAAVAQQVGTCVSVVKLAKDPEQRLFWGSLALTWYDSKPIQPDLEFLKVVAGKRDRQRVFETDLVTGLLVRSETLWVNPLPGIMTEGHTYDTQVYLPMPRTTWTALVSGSTVAAAHADLMEKLVCRMALSLDPDLPAEKQKKEPAEAVKPSEETDAVRSRLRSAVRSPTTVPSDESGDGDIRS